MPTVLPQPPSLGATAPRRRCGLCRTATMLALLLLGRLLFSASMAIADLADSFVRRD